MADNLTFSNLAKSTLMSDISTGDTLININDHTNFPPVGLFTAVIWSGLKSSPPLEDADSEIVHLTHTADNGFTAVRGKEATSAKDWKANNNIAHVITAETMGGFIHDSAMVNASYSVIPDNTYDMKRADTNSVFTFGSDEMDKTVNLPEAALADGLTYHLLCYGVKSSQCIRLYPQEGGDSFSKTDNQYIKLAFGTRVTLTSINNKWEILGYDNNIPFNMKIVDSSNPYVASGDGIVYADASDGDLAINLHEPDGITGIPVTIIRYDDSENNVYVQPFTGPNMYVNLACQYQSITFVTESDGTKRIINSHLPTAKNALTIDSSINLRGYERYIFATTGATQVAVRLTKASVMAGLSIYFKKTGQRRRQCNDHT